MAFLIFLRLIVNIESLLHKTFSILIILPSWIAPLSQSHRIMDWITTYFALYAWPGISEKQPVSAINAYSEPQEITIFEYPSHYIIIIL
jgi:hypothetical protein